jgi:uncharacterized protein
VNAPGQRDRDAAGRARNARPRDWLGRPLARDESGEPVLPDGVAVTPEWALTTAQELLDAGRPFHAHEVLEAAWKAAAPAERDFWQGLAQLAVGITHALRGNSSGAASLLRRGSTRLRGYDGARLHGVDTGALGIAAKTLADRIDSQGLDPISPADLRLRLRSVS